MPASEVLANSHAEKACLHRSHKNKRLHEGESKIISCGFSAGPFSDSRAGGTFRLLSCSSKVTGCMWLRSSHRCRAASSISRFVDPLPCPVGPTRNFLKTREKVAVAKTSAVSMAVEKGAKTAVVWLLFTLPLSLLEGGVLSERPAAVKGAPALRGEANPSRRGPF